MKVIKTGSDFSGVGAFDQALERLGIKQDKQFACDMDKFARQTYIYNFGEPKYYPVNVYDREIPKESLDIYMTSPPCQAFSLAGNRKGEADKRGVLFYNSHEFIQKNKPRFFIFENVKGLLSDDSGKTFQRWIDFLGGKTVNGNPVIFPHEDSVPYHVYYQVLNAKHYGIPQNRERIFIIGIRDDQDNDFSFPKPFPLVKRLKDVLESEVDEKYFLSDKMIENFTIHKDRHDNKGTGFGFKPKTEYDKTANCLRANAAICATDNMLIVGDLNKGGERGAVYSYHSGIMSCLTATDYKQPKQVMLGYTRCSKGKVTSRHEKDLSGTIHTASGGGGNTDQFVITQQRIRRLTPLECFRLMDFNETFKWDVSDSQAYKQAGNSICVGVLAKIIERLKL